MTFFKYTVTNKKGRKLNGTVEAPSEKTAREELNNLGFSILFLKETKELPKAKDNRTKFVFEAMDKNSKMVSGTIPGKNEEEIYEKLKSEYTFTVTAIWALPASDKQIQEARLKWQKRLREELLSIDTKKNNSSEKELANQKETVFTKHKIESILAEVNKLLQNYEEKFQPDQTKKIKKKINKLLRIKNSTNLQYILSTAEDLLKFIQEQEKTLQEKGLQEERFKLQIKTQNLLDQLKTNSKPKTLSEDILSKINSFEGKNTGERSTNFINKIIISIKKSLTDPEEIKIIKLKITTYNKQILEFAKLYFKEPNKQYKQKIIKSIKTLWKARKKTKHSLKYAKKLIKKRHQETREKQLEETGLIDNINTFSGWLLTFYLLYYFISLYITTKDFGLKEIPKNFYIHDSKLFKYILGITFALHISTALKTYFFKKNILANIILSMFFITSSLIIILNS